MKVLLASPRTDCDQATTDGATPVFVGAKRGHIDIVRAFVDRPDMDFGATFNGEAAAAVARRQGHTDTAFLLNIARIAIEGDKVRM